MIGARLRHERGWSDRASSTCPVARPDGAGAPGPRRWGAYVEIHRGTHRIVARVVWAESGICSALRTQDDYRPRRHTGGRGERRCPVAANLNDDRRDWRPPPRRPRAAEQKPEILAADGVRLLIYSSSPAAAASPRLRHGGRGAVQAPEDGGSAAGRRLAAAFDPLRTLDASSLSLRHTARVGAFCDLASCTHSVLVISHLPNLWGRWQTNHQPFS